MNFVGKIYLACQQCKVNFSLEISMSDFECKASGNNKFMKEIRQSMHVPNHVLK